MNLLSANVGLPREVEWNGRTIRTSIFKAPVSGRVHVRKLSEASLETGYLVDDNNEVLPCDLTLFPKHASPITSFPIIPANTGSFPNYKDKILNHRSCKGPSPIGV